MLTTFFKPSYKYPEGVFFLHYRDGNYACLQSCRELIGKYWLEEHRHLGHESNCLGFSTGMIPFDITNFKTFLHPLEEALGWTPTTIRSTNEPGTVILYPSEQWLTYNLRRSVYTLLVRAATYYKGDRARALMDYGLARKCSKALDFFLAGNTLPTTQGGKQMDMNNLQGFVWAFNNDRIARGIKLEDCMWSPANISAPPAAPSPAVPPLNLFDSLRAVQSQPQAVQVQSDGPMMWHTTTSVPSPRSYGEEIPF